MTNAAHDDPTLPQEAIILVGGRGERLASVVSDVPKPLAPVGGRPFVAWIVEALRRAGVRRIIFATGHLAEHLEAHFGTGAEWGVDICYSRDPQPLGTGGAVRLALGLTRTNPLLVLNGDSICRIDVPRLARHHQQSRAGATLWLLPQSDCRRFASVSVAEDGAVLGFHEKSSGIAAGLISAGVYLMERETLARIPADRPVSLEHEVFPKLVGHGLHAVIGDALFVDIGTPDSYAGALNILDRILGLR